MLEEIVEYRQPLFHRNIGNEIEIKSTYYEIIYKASFCSFLNNLMPLFSLQMYLVERRWRMKKQKRKGTSHNSATQNVPLTIFTYYFLSC